ncbi:hypothetical protein RclHR1_00330039 [Rhizophagus clarus]|uniref:BTB domain-containing protein n=1 Tax=Rhizophagus clarus TaxID=94130 RepID=A0A2Z6RCN6_9GLOM|nr:hypothetical protein RclHR1_00330039 [Rhizophagus clarus]
MSGKIVARKFHDNLFRDILSMLKDTNSHDVIIYVGENQYDKKFTAHSNILKARSKYFKNNLSNKYITRKDNLIEIKKPSISPNVFRIILEYIYTGKMCLTNQSGEDVLGLIVASEELLFDELFTYLQEHMIKYQRRWIQQNLVLALHTVSEISNYKNLRELCIQFILEDPQVFITSKEFLSLDENILSELLKRDDLQLEEIVIWEYLIKWGIKQTFGLSNIDRTKWNKEDYEALKETLNKLIPLIRFSEISSDDFYDKVCPFEVVIPNHIYKEVLKFYMKGVLSEGVTALPPRAGVINIDSKIIKPNHAYIIANWIDRRGAKDIRKKDDLKYEFKINHRSSLCGINFGAINNLCNGYEHDHNPYLILVQRQNTYNISQQKSQNSSQNFKIYGEYNSFNPKNDSFIFSFENENDIKNTKICRDMNAVLRFNKYNQNVHVKMLEYCNGDVEWTNENFVPIKVEIFTVNVN